MTGGFDLRESGGIFYYSCAAIEKLPGIQHGFSTRRGKPGPPGSSFNLGYTQWDTPESVAENRRLFLTALKLRDARLATLHQIHSDRVYIIKDNLGQWNQPEGDALITRAEGIAIGVQMADCLPVLVADPLSGAIAAVHSGWRGTLARLLLKTIREMQKAFSCDPANLIVAIGPGIRACCFEVEGDVISLFDREYHKDSLSIFGERRPGKFLLDLVGALRIQLKEAGADPRNIHDSGACTRCNVAEFFSHRAEAGRSGRMMAVIGRNEQFSMRRVHTDQA
jgi:polyphenol oxidase